MVKGVILGLALAAMPLAPAAAVVTIAVPAKPPQAARPPASLAGTDTSMIGSFSFGEIAAALAGLAVLGLARASGRQPHSVTA